MITNFNPSVPRVRMNTPNKAVSFEAKFKEKDIQNIINREAGSINGLLTMTRAGHYTRDENADIVRKLLKEHPTNPAARALAQILDIK